jgi:Protein of unknown function (DUF3800)
MQILYIDESGDLGSLPAVPAPNDQPVLVLGALIVDVARLEAVTHDFLNLKRQWFPGLNYPSNNHLDRIIPEIKGADIRRSVTRQGRNQRRHAIGFLDHLMQVLAQHGVKLLARVWVKGLAQPFDGRSVYTSSIQGLYTYFESYLTLLGDIGVCIADSRDHWKNANVAHSIFTQKFRASSTVYSRIAELPTFGHSENHAGIQICDILCSALLYPIAAEAYCTGHVTNVHVQPRAALLRQRFGPVLKSMQYRYQDPNGKWIGGIVVSDAINQRNATAMFS